MLAEITFTFSKLFRILQAFAKQAAFDFQLATPKVIERYKDTHTNLAILRNFDSVHSSRTSSAGYSCQVNLFLKPHN